MVLAISKDPKKYYRKNRFDLVDHHQNCSFMLKQIYSEKLMLAHLFRLQTLN